MRALERARYQLWGSGGAADLLGTNYLNGMVRIMMGIIFVIGIAAGVSLALRIL